jgi:drug/metabolite transporter (DMT)-like permease
LLIAIGIIGTLAHLLMTWSLKFAPSATVAPVQYLEIPCATVIGLIVFGDLPDGLAATGMAVTIVAGLYVLHREATVARQVAADTTTI